LVAFADPTPARNSDIRFVPRATEGDPGKRSTTMNYVMGAVTVLLLILITIFSIQNLESIDLSFLVWSISVPKALLILGIYVLGMVSGWGVVELVKQVF
jgi:putative membrane protein